MLEFLVTNAVLAAVLATTRRTTIAQLLLVPRPLDVAVCAVLLSASLVLVVVLKVVNGTLLYMLQPCHVYAALLLAVALLGTQSRAGHFLFNFCADLYWVGILPCFFPDTQDLDAVGRASFWIEHLLIAAVPLVYCLHFSVAAFDLRAVLRSFVAIAFYHSMLLTVLSHAVNANINYVVRPPPSPLTLFGAFYRPIMYAFCMLLTISSRLLFALHCRAKLL